MSPISPIHNQAPNAATLRRSTSITPSTPFRALTTRSRRCKSLTSTVRSILRVPSFRISSSVLALRMLVLMLAIVLVNAASCFAEHLRDVVRTRQRVFYHVVKQAGAHRGHVHLHIRQNGGDRERMDQIWLS